MVYRTNVPILFTADPGSGGARGLSPSQLRRQSGAGGDPADGGAATELRRGASPGFTTVKNGEQPEVHREKWGVYREQMEIL